jgi:hypothetical protein
MMKETRCSTRLACRNYTALYPRSGRCENLKSYTNFVALRYYRNHFVRNLRFAAPLQLHREVILHVRCHQFISMATLRNAVVKRKPAMEGRDSVTFKPRCFFGSLPTE